jgi:hypothetical protein
MFLFYLWITLNWYAVSPPFCDLILEPDDSLYIRSGREKVGKSKMLIFQGNDSKFHIIPKIL